MTHDQTRNTLDEAFTGLYGRTLQREMRALVDLSAFYTHEDMVENAERWFVLMTEATRERWLKRIAKIEARRAQRSTK